MADVNPHPDATTDADDATHAGPPTEPTEPTAGAPRWVKVFGVITLVVAVLLVALLLVGGGNHGPGRHTGSGEAGGQTAPAAGVAVKAGVRGHAPPAGGHASR